VCTVLICWFVGFSHLNWVILNPGLSRLLIASFVSKPLWWIRSSSRCNWMKYFEWYQSTIIIIYTNSLIIQKYYWSECPDIVVWELSWMMTSWFLQNCFIENLIIDELYNRTESTLNWLQLNWTMTLFSF